MKPEPGKTIHNMREMVNPKLVLLDDHELCDLLKLSRTTLWEMRRTGVLPPPIRHGGRRNLTRLSVAEKYLREMLAAAE